ncbi:extracellular solute-binding protein [Acutalibacter caecimuris]|uniref:extracellular solute-binding protein n=1 Tax=Acutalibacter caecimuris TaxID=3093657 RepID=UPI002AC9E52F|nr:extracellular solute-binding protein [Acutalibacter sp. M00118]
MKQNWKKALSLLLVLCLLATLFAACGGKDNGNSSSGPAGNEGGAAEDANFNATGYPIVNEPVTLTFLYVKGAGLRDLNENSMFQEMEKVTNVHIDWQYAGDADWGEQKSLLLAGGDLPDVFFGNNSLGDVDILTNLDLFVPLEDYIEEYCPNIKAAYEAEPIMRKLITQPDGHIYTLSSKLPLRPKACDVPYINQKWLDNLGLEMPTTVDEWYNVLKAFKEQDANGNGDLNDEIPFGGSGKGDMGGWIQLY